MWLSSPRMAKPPGAPACIVKLRDLIKNGANNGRYDQLGNPLAISHQELLAAMIHDNDADFPPIVSIDGPGRIEHGNAVAKGKAAAGPDLGLISLRKGDGYTGRNQAALSGQQENITLQIGIEVHSGRMAGHIPGERIG